MELTEDFRVLAESENYLLGHVYELGLMVKKDSGEEIYMGDYYGDPDFGLIDKDEKWALLCGTDSYLWKADTLIHLNREDTDFAELFHYPFAARQESKNIIQLLDGPLAGNSSAYNFNVETFGISKLATMPYATEPEQWNIQSFWEDDV